MAEIDFCFPGNLRIFLIVESWCTAARGWLNTEPIFMPSWYSKWEFSLCFLSYFYVESLATLEYNTYFFKMFLNCCSLFCISSWGCFIYNIIKPQRNPYGGREGRNFAISLFYSSLIEFMWNLKLFKSVFYSQGVSPYLATGWLKKMGILYYTINCVADI